MLTCRVTSHYVLHETLTIMSIIINSDKFRYIVVYLELCVAHGLPAIFTSLAYLKPEIYSELCQSIFWHIQNAIRYHVQNFTIFRILAYLGPKAYSESCLFRHIQAYWGIFSIFNNDNFNKSNFFFFSVYSYILFN